MSGPPANVSSSQLWAELSKMPRPSRVVDFPRKTFDGKSVGELAIRVLTQEEQMGSSAAAEQFARTHLKEAKGGDLGYDKIFADAFCVELLHRACRDVEDESRPAFPSTVLLRKQLTTDECGVLFEHYLTVQLEVGPIVSRMTEEDMKAWLARIEEAGSAYPFDLLTSDQQKILLLFSARLALSSLTVTDSVGSPPDSGSPRSEPDDVSETDAAVVEGPSS